MCKYLANSLKMSIFTILKETNITNIKKIRVMKTNNENQKKAFIRNIVDTAVNFGLDSIQCQIAMSIPQRVYDFSELNSFIGEMTIALHNAGVKLPSDNL